MQKDERFKIQLKFANKVIPLFCKRSDEGLFRKAASAINDLINRYGSKFEGGKISSDDLLAMAAIHISIENILMKQNEDTSPLIERIDLLNKELEEYLKSINLD